jgi:hypothetical protein
VKIQRCGPTTSAASVRVVSTDVTASTGTDYTAINQVVQLPAGVAAKNLAVPLLPDSQAEGNETFRLDLQQPTGSVLGTHRTATVTIVDDDDPTVFFANPTYKAAENAVSIPITVRRSGDLSGIVTVDYAASDGSAGMVYDYQGAQGSLSFGSGVSMLSFAVYPVDDTVHELTEDLFVTLANPSGAVLGTQSVATVTITDNDKATPTARPTPIPTVTPRPRPTTRPTATARPRPTPVCCDCYFDVFCTAYGPGGCWYCGNVPKNGDSCPAPQQPGGIVSPGACACDPELYQVCP